MFNINVDNGFLKQLDKMENNIEEIENKMLKNAEPLLTQAIKQSMNMVTQSDLPKTVKATKIQDSKNGKYVGVYPQGKNKEGKRNAELAAYLEYGTTQKGKRHQPARPYMKRALKNAEPKVVKKLQETFEGEIK